jgi:mono/diheme cytochrome c family protein
MENSTGSRRLCRGVRLPFACALAAAALALATGCGEDEPARRVVQVEPIARDRWVYARARFREMCAGCHTLADAGARGPRFNLDVIGDLTEERVRHVILEGEPGMPGWRDIMSRREIEELVEYVSSVERQVQGEEDWHWQISLREAGSKWVPEDGRYPPDPPKR